jgi:phenylacetic acid degradation operon negative regulatory protein
MKPKPLSAATLILDVLAASVAGQRTAQELCCAGAIMGHNDATMRVALTRLAQQGKILKRDKATYSLNSQRNRLQLEIENWRARADWIAPWRGKWIVVHDAAADRSDKTSLRRHERALLLRGLRKWKQGLFVRPDNLVGGAPALRRDLQDLGLAQGAELFAAQDFSEQQNSDLLELWNISGLQREYKKLLARAKTGRQRLLELRPENAARESLLVGRDLIGHILRDPLLPFEILAEAQFPALVREVEEYQIHSREIWDHVLRPTMRLSAIRGRPELASARPK